MSVESIEYYEREGGEFACRTANVDMSPIYREFLPLVPPSGTILDAGCGGGRDTKYFCDQGYKVNAFDASLEMVNIARAATQIQVSHCRFIEYDSRLLFDGIWACASLLHLDQNELRTNLSHLFGLLKSGGIFYASFKLGSGLRTGDDGRLFLDQDEAALGVLTKDLNGLEIEKVWRSNDQRAERQSSKWINVLWRKVS